MTFNHKYRKSACTKVNRFPYFPLSSQLFLLPLLRLWWMVPTFLAKHCLSHVWWVWWTDWLSNQWLYGRNMPAMNQFLPMPSVWIHLIMGAIVLSPFPFSTPLMLACTHVEPSSPLTVLMWMLLLKTLRTSHCNVSLSQWYHSLRNFWAKKLLVIKFLPYLHYKNRFVKLTKLFVTVMNLIWKKYFFVIWTNFFAFNQNGLCWFNKIFVN